MNNNVIKIVGIMASAVGMGATLVGNWASDKQMEIKVAQMVAEALAKEK